MNLTQQMTRFRLAQQAGDQAAAQRIASEAIHQARPAIPRPMGYTLTPTGATFPELAVLDQTAYQAIKGDVTRLASEVARLETQNRVLRGELQQQSQLAYDAQRRLTQALARIAELEAAGESSDQE